MMHTQTDESGYFVAVLPAGVYRVSNGSFSVETTLENGTTVLVPLRAGKGWWTDEPADHSINDTGAVEHGSTGTPAGQAAWTTTTCSSSARQQELP
ncbi:MAG: hypothetical protein IPQ16_14665 [Geobacteraceae bacterium]|nr:hypothetical protein [Geobacteraceae bacterium]